MHVTNHQDQHRIRQQVYNNARASAGMCQHLELIQVVHQTSL